MNCKYIIRALLLILNYSIAYGQDGVVSKDLTLNNRITSFIANENSSDNDLYGIVQDIQKAGDLEQGVRIMNVAIQRFPNSYFPYYMRGFYYKNLGRYDDAISDFSAAITYEPRYAAALLDRGECLLFKNEVTEARKDFNSAIKNVTIS